MTAAAHIFKPSREHAMVASLRAQQRIGELVGVPLDTPLDEVLLTQKGVPIAVYSKSLKELGVNKADMSWVIAPRTLTHRKSKKEPLTREESGRWLRAAKMQALAEEVFGSKDKASQWLQKNRQQFAGQSAASLIQTESGAKLVEDTLNQIDAGYIP